MSYLTAMLLDASKPFRYRPRVRSLLGLPEHPGSHSRIYAASNTLPEFKYLLRKFHRFQRLPSNTITSSDPFLLKKKSAETAFDLAPAAPCVIQKDTESAQLPGTQTDHRALIPRKRIHREMEIKHYNITGSSTNFSIDPPESAREESTDTSVRQGSHPTTTNDFLSGYGSKETAEKKNAMAPSFSGVGRSNKRMPVTIRPENHLGSRADAFRVTVENPKKHQNTKQHIAAKTAPEINFAETKRAHNFSSATLHPLAEKSSEQVIPAASPSVNNSAACRMNAIEAKIGPDDDDTPATPYLSFKNEMRSEQSPAATSNAFRSPHARAKNATTTGTNQADPDSSRPVNTSVARCAGAIRAKAETVHFPYARTTGSTNTAKGTTHLTTEASETKRAMGQQQPRASECAPQGGLASGRQRQHRTSEVPAFWERMSLSRFPLRILR